MGLLSGANCSSKPMTVKVALLNQYNQRVVSIPMHFLAIPAEKMSFKKYSE
jgi:hypothetical protein